VIRIAPTTTAIAARIVTALAVLLSASLACSQAPSRWTGASRVVAVGDVHGAYRELVDVLEATGVIDADLRWSGGETHLVSVGDLLDRGADSRRVLDLLMRLQGEAVEHGGQVHVTLGNHELMNLTGDLRYVSAGEYAAFASEETDVMRAGPYAEFATKAGEDAAATRALFDKTFPRGYFAHRDAFDADGIYGSWLLSLPAIVVVDGTAFVHGGLPALVASASLDELNDKLREGLRRYLELRGELAASAVLPDADMREDIALAHRSLETASPELVPILEEFIALGDAPELGLDGPLWYRGSVYCKPILEEPILDAALAQLNAARVVVGHTPTGDRRVRSLYDGKLVMLDTGMLTAYYAGRPAALVLEGSDAYVQYAVPPQRAEIEAGDAHAYGLTETQLRDALEHGTVSPVEKGGRDDPWRVAVRYNDVAINAIFYARNANDAGNLELAAAELDDLLGASLVAPTVPRVIDGQEGALQLRYSDEISETQRLERRLGFTGWCPIEPQLGLMYAFDALTVNRGRSADNVLYNNGLSDLSLTDHRRAFGTERTIPSGAPNIPAPFLDALRALDRVALEAALGKWLDSRRLRALLERRDRLLAGR
jgi:hypothetical protein